MYELYVLHDNLFLWSLVLTVCAFVLLVQTLQPLRRLLSKRQPLWRYALVILSLGISLASFAIAIHTTNVYDHAPFAHSLTLASYLMLKNMWSQTSTSCILQICLTVVAFILTLLVERKAASHAVPQAWVVAQDIRGRL